MSLQGLGPRSVGDPSSRVWVAMRRVLSGLTRELRTHRSSYENGDDTPGRFVPSSVNIGNLRTVVSVRNGTERRSGHSEICPVDPITVLSFSSGFIS